MMSALASSSSARSPNPHTGRGSWQDARGMSDIRHEQLRSKVGDLWDVVKLTTLAAWDQQTMMPPRGGAVREGRG